MEFDSITEESIRELVYTFYAKVRKDVQLAPVFEGVIGTEEAQWEPHLQAMCDFWSAIMLTSGRYHGNPMRKHQGIPPFPQELFARWLELFAETAQELHTPPMAQAYIEKSRRIAQSLQYGLYPVV